LPKDAVKQMPLEPFFAPNLYVMTKSCVESLCLQAPYKGKTTDRRVVEEMKKQYYEAIGWDENGIPKSEVLRNLGLEDVDKALEKLRK